MNRILKKSFGCKWRKPPLSDKEKILLTEQCMLKSSVTLANCTVQNESETLTDYNNQR